MSKLGYLLVMGAAAAGCALALSMAAGCTGDLPTLEPPPAAAKPTTRTPVGGVLRPLLQPVVDALAAEVAARSPGTELAIAVQDLNTGEHAQVAEGVTHVSAS